MLLCFRERRCAFSLDFRPFGPSVLDRARSKVVLQGEGYAWTLQEVGIFFSYFCYFLAKTHVNGYECFSRKFDLKSSEPSEENFYLCGHE